MTRIVFGIGHADLLDALFQSLARSSALHGAGAVHVLSGDDFISLRNTPRMSRRRDDTLLSLAERLDRLVWMIKMKGFSGGTTAVALDNLARDQDGAMAGADMMDRIGAWCVSRGLDASCVIAEPDAHWLNIARFLDTLHMALLPPAAEPDGDTTRQDHGPAHLVTPREGCLVLKVDVSGLDAVNRLQTFLGLTVTEDHAVRLSRDSSLGRAQYAAAHADVLRGACGAEGFPVLKRT